MNSYPIPSTEDLKKARSEFVRIEPRDFFYWSVTKLVDSIIEAESPNIDDLVRALMMLLTTWNKNYYRFFINRKGGQTLEEHFLELEGTIQKHFESLRVFRARSLDSLDENDLGTIAGLFYDFTTVLGRVGAAKCLHLLAPRFFPLWDRSILIGYQLETGKFRHATDTERYITFMRITLNQLRHLNNLNALPSNPLKSLDEYNYCKFTKNILD